MRHRRRLQSVAVAPTSLQPLQPQKWLRFRLRPGGDLRRYERRDGNRDGRSGGRKGDASSPDSIMDVAHDRDHRVSRPTQQEGKISQEQGAIDLSAIGLFTMWPLISLCNPELLNRVDK